MLLRNERELVVSVLYCVYTTFKFVQTMDLGLRRYNRTW